MDEPARVLHHPLRVDAHVVGNHVGGQANAARAGSATEVVVRKVAAELGRDVVVVKGIGLGHRLGIAHATLDLA